MHIRSAPQWSARGNRSRVSAVRTERNRGWVLLAAHERFFNVGAEAWMPHVVRRFAHVVAEPCATIVAALAGRSDAAVGAEAFTGAALPFHFLCIGGLASRDQSRGSVANPSRLQSWKQLVVDIFKLVLHVRGAASVGTAYGRYSRPTSSATPLTTSREFEVLLAACTAHYSATAWGANTRTECPQAHATLLLDRPRLTPRYLGCYVSGLTSSC